MLKGELLELVLHIKARTLGKLGRNEEAMDAFHGAIAIGRGLVETQPEVFHWRSLAKNLNNLGNRLDDLERVDEALPVLLEAVEIHRRLALVNPERYRAELAGSLNNLGVIYEHLDRSDLAFACFESSVRELVPAFLNSPGAFQGWMQEFLDNYRKYPKEAGVDVDKKLISLLPRPTQ